MIKKLSISRIFLLLLTVCSLGLQKADAVPTQILTGYTAGGPLPGVFFFSTTAVPPTVTHAYITFKVYNSNPYPISVDTIFTYHPSGISFPTITYNSNNRTYLLYAVNNYNNAFPLAMSGPVSFSPLDGWKSVQSSLGISTTTSGVVPVFTNLGYVICPNTEARFCLVTDTLMQMAGTTGPLAPTTFTQNGVSVTADQSQYWGFGNAGLTGTVLGAALNTNQNTPAAPFYPGFNGGISFDTTFTPPAPVIAANPTQICKGSSAVLTATSPLPCAKTLVYWSWAGGHDTGATITVTPAATTKYFCYLIRGGKDTSLASNLIVNVIDPPKPLVDGKTAFCINDLFVPVTVTGTGIQWFYSASGGSALPIIPTVNTSLGAHNDTFYVGQTVSGCPSERAMVTYSVAAKPAAPIVTSPITYCEGDPSVPLSAIGQNLVWYYFPSGGIPSTTPPVPPTTVQGTFDYYVSQNNKGCEGPRSNIEVKVTYRPNGLVVASKDEICEHDSVSFKYYGSAFPDAAYSWSLPVGAKELSREGDTVRTVQFDTAGSKTLLLVIGNSRCYSPVYNSTVMVDSVPHAEIAVNDEPCPGIKELVSLRWFSNTIDTFLWDFGNAQVTNFTTDQGPYAVTWYTPGQNIITLHIADSKCPNTIYDTVDVHAYPDASFKIDGYSLDKVYCTSDSLRLVANTLTVGSKYTWTPARFFDTYSDIGATYARVDLPGYVKLTVIDPAGCVASDSLLVKTEPCCQLTFPTAFTPNNDGHNDLFHCLTPGNHEVKSFKVFNRLGQTVFETANELRGWDGKYNGKAQDMDTYFYIVQFKCDNKLMTQKGDVTLVR